MSSLGDLLREAREQKGVSPSEAAEATHIKVQIIDDLEHNRFHRTYAPIYAKGFIRLYADYLDLNASILLDAYEQQSAGDTPTPTDMVKQIPKARKAAAAAQDPASTDHGNSVIPILRERITALATTILEHANRLRVRLQSRVEATSRRPPSSPDVLPEDGIPEPAGPSDPISQSDRQAPTSRTKPLRALLHGPNRAVTAALVVGFLIVILTLIGVLAARRHSHERSLREDRTPEQEATTSAIEFLIPPPAPYYR